MMEIYYSLLLFIQSFIILSINTIEFDHKVSQVNNTNGTDF